MLLNFNKGHRPYIIIVALTLAAIPIVITAFQLITTTNQSVVFLEGFNPIVTRVIEIYYALLLMILGVWIIFQIKTILKLKNEKRKNEVLHLQNQVNPHFFFNSLNNLYGLIDVDAEKAKVLILKLSELMRYSIYEGDRKTVHLKEEIGYLKNYIELHQMRYHKEIDIKFTIDMDENQYQVMPLMYIILLENAFKHGVENLRKNAFVHIHLKAFNKKITFDIANNFDESEVPTTSGIGVQNLKRRLELVYPKRHRITFTKSSSVYRAILHLEL